jgi:hypothetical protein
MGITAYRDSPPWTQPGPCRANGIRLIRQIRCHILIDGSLVNKHQNSTVEILLLGDRFVTQQQL